MVKQKSVKTINYNVGQKVYYIDGPYRGEIVKCLKISVHLKLPDGSIVKVNKRVLGKVITNT